jgi:hypothetical protein
MQSLISATESSNNIYMNESDGKAADLERQEEETKQDESSAQSTTTSTSFSLQIEEMQCLLQSQRVLLPFYKSEPRILSSPPLPDRLLQEGLNWQEDMLLSLQMLIWITEVCLRKEKTPAEISKNLSMRSLTSPKTSLLSVEQYRIGVYQSVAHCLISKRFYYH